MRKLLVIAADQEVLGAAPGPHTFKPAHETQLREAAGSALEIVVATPEEGVAHYGDAEAVAAFPRRMPKLGDLAQAKWLHLFSAGVDKVLTPEVQNSSVLLSSSSGVHATPIAEYILTTCLMFARGFHKTFANQRKHLWQPDQTMRELRDARVLIVGLGAIGREAARLAHAFGAQVSAVSRSGNDKPDFVEHLEKVSELDAMLPEADYVVITLPGTSETKNMFDAKRLALLKPSAVIINIGRGGIINEADLAESLKAGRLAGAALDVFETEPLQKESPLWDMEHVVITPHHSGLSHKYMDRAIEVLCKNIRAYVKGESLPNEVNKALGY